MLSNPQLSTSKRIRCPRNFWTLVHSMLFWGDTKRLGHENGADTLIFSDITLTHVEPRESSGLRASGCPSLIWASSCAHGLKFSPSAFSSVFPQVYCTWGWQGWSHKCPLLPVAGIQRSHHTPSVGSTPHVKCPPGVALSVSFGDSETRALQWTLSCL